MGWLVAVSPAQSPAVTSSLHHSLQSPPSLRSARGCERSIQDDGLHTTRSWMRVGLSFAGVASGFAAHYFRRHRRESCPTVMHGMKDRVRKEFSVKSAMIKRLGKWHLQKEFDLRKQIEEDEKLAARTGKSKEELLTEFDRTVNFLKTELGTGDVEASICVSKAATGLHMQYLGKPNLPTNESMSEVLAWLEQNLAASKADGSLKRVVENYPFVLSRTIPELEESKRFCPADIDFDHAVAEDPALIDKTYNCDGICASQCLACWFNG